MKKKEVFFLMLFLFVLETASMNAQVRIGGENAPHGAAILDLNANNDSLPTDNKGALALPRVVLTDSTTILNGTTPMIGMMVYNTGGKLSSGVYYWNGIKWLSIIDSSSPSIVYRSFIPTMNFSPYAGSTGFGTIQVIIVNCPKVLDMVTLHGQAGYSIPGDKWTMWSVYFENHTNYNLYGFNVDEYTMGFMMLSIDSDGKPYWGGAQSQGHPIPAVFRCIE